MNRVNTFVVWLQLCVCCWGAGTIQPVSLEQYLQTTAQSGSEVVNDRSRSRMHGTGGVDVVRSEASAGCFEIASETTTLLQDDLARITLNTDVQACSSPSNSLVTASGTTQLTLSVDRTTRKLIALAKSSTEPMSGTATLFRVGQQRPLWHAELAENAQQVTSAFAIELSVGEYIVELTTKQETSRAGTSDIRLSLVNRGDINGNEEFDDADLEVMDAILRQTTYVVPADLDDDGDNDIHDRRLWVDGLQTDVNRTSRALEIVAVSDPWVKDTEPTELPNVQPDQNQTPTPPVTPEPNPEVVIELETPLIAPRPIGDINGDGTVGFRDFLEFSDSFGASAEVNESADLNQDGIIGFADFLVFSRNYPGNSSATTVNTPEPTSLFLVTLCTIALARLRRHRPR